MARGYLYTGGLEGNQDGVRTRVVYPFVALGQVVYPFWIDFRENHTAIKTNGISLTEQFYPGFPDDGEGLGKWQSGVGQNIQAIVNGCALEGTGG